MREKLSLVYMEKYGKLFPPLDKKRANGYNSRQESGPLPGKAALLKISFGLKKPKIII